MGAFIAIFGAVSTFGVTCNYILLYILGAILAVFSSYFFSGGKNSSTILLFLLPFL